MTVRLSFCIPSVFCLSVRPIFITLLHGLLLKFTSSKFYETYHNVNTQNTQTEFKFRKWVTYISKGMPFIICKNALTFRSHSLNQFGLIWILRNSSATTIRRQSLYYHDYGSLSLTILEVCPLWHETLQCFGEGIRVIRHIFHLFLSSFVNFLRLTIFDCSLGIYCPLYAPSFST